MKSYAEAKREWSRRYIVHALIEANDNVSEAARLAQVNRTDFHRLIRQHGIRRLLKSSRGFNHDKRQKARKLGGGA